MSLSKENIQFIDNYLKNNEVIYYDIRMEMLDHVASAVEQKMETENLDFYDAFKSYMVLNKKEILKGNRIWSIYSKDTIFNFLKFLANPFMILIGILFYIFFKKIEVTNYFNDSFSINNLFLLSILFVALFQVFYFYIYLKERFYIIEKIGGILALLNYAQIFFFNGLDKEAPSNIVMSIFFYLLFAYIAYFTNEVLKFNKKKKFLLQ